MWLVIHIPKAAGTSFRWSLEKHFGKSKVIRDYGPQSSATTKVVREHLYSEDDSKDTETLVKEISASPARILVGHFPLERYAKFFEPERVITFVREPLVRTCSEYLHRTNNRTFEGSLTDFLHRPGYQNLQTRFLKGVSKLSFIGLAEKYDDSLKLINAATGWKISNSIKNIGQQGGGRRLAETLSPGEMDLFYKTNQKDLELYGAMKQRFETFKIPDSTSKGIMSFFKQN